MRPTNLQGARDVAQRSVHDALMPKELFAFLVEMQQQQQQQQQTNEATNQQTNKQANKQTNKNENNECPVAIISHMYGAPEHKQKGCLCYAQNKTSCVANPNQELL